MKLYEIYHEVNDFADGSNHLYIYGAGSYGDFVLEFLRREKHAVSGFIETEKTQSTKGGLAVYASGEVLKILEEGDRIIIAFSKNTQGNLYLDYLTDWGCEYLALQKWQLWELSRFGQYYKNWDFYKNKEVGEEFFERESAIEKERQEIKRKELLQLQLVYGFDDWHVETDNPYGNDIALTISELSKGLDHEPVIVECGCGLCNIIGNDALSNSKRIAIDQSEQVLNASKYLFRENIDFREGSFEQVVENRVDFLVSVNFMNSMSPVEVRQAYDILFKDRFVSYYIVDEVTGDYLFHHKFKDFLPSEFELRMSLGPYGAAKGIRYIRIFECHR